MLKNLILSAAAAGVAAGLFTAVIQHVTTTPLIIEAEKYEGAVSAHSHAARADQHSASEAGSHDASLTPTTPAAEWAPSDGLERTLYTSVSTTVMGVGFGLALLGAMALAGVRIDARSGLAFGVAAFVAVALAPALGLPPEIPGAAPAALGARQLWWFFAVAATAIGIAAFVLGGSLWLQAAGVGLIALPHIVGAPGSHEYVSTAPAELAGQFVATSLAVTAIFWTMLGYASGAFYEHLSRSG
jgi:cobalt transporter subunit CbtA